MTVPRDRCARHSLRPVSIHALLLLVAGAALLQCAAKGSGRPGALPPSSFARGEPRTRPITSDGPALRGSQASISSSIHVALGTPRDANPSDEYFIDQRSFVLSYNPEKRVANWVAWQLDRTHLGHVRRKNDFRSDFALPARFYRVKESDYLHSGYDRGHLCPSADRQSSAEDNSRTFLFTNIEPQLHELNAGPWEQLERYARKRVQRGAQLYIVAGGVFAEPSATIGNGVAVPSASYKIIVELRQGQGPNQIDERTRVLAVLMPNRHGVGDHEWTEYLTSVDAIEQATGYDFLNAIPEHTQRVLEARVPVLTREARYDDAR